MKILDIFSSIQGEGIYVGVRQIFVRFAFCNLNCEYCDENIDQGEEMSQAEVIGKVRELNHTWHHSISLTGGEPLIQVEALKSLIPELELPVYLETNGTLPANLRELVGMVDVYSMDFKPDYVNGFRESLMLIGEEDTFVKYVLLPGQRIMEIKELASIVKAVNPDIPLVIQPVTPHGKIKHMPDSDHIIAAYTLAKKYVNDVRVIPQTHKWMKLK